MWVHQDFVIQFIFYIFIYFFYCFLDSPTNNFNKDRLSLLTITFFNVHCVVELNVLSKLAGTIFFYLSIFMGFSWRNVLCRR